MDSFLRGLMACLKDPHQESFTMRDSPDPEAVVAFLQAISDGLKYLAGSVAKLHLNHILARRESLLLGSSVA